MKKSKSSEDGIVRGQMHEQTGMGNVVLTLKHRKPAMEWNLLDFVTVNLVKLSISFGMVPVTLLIKRRNMRISLNMRVD